MNYDHDINLRAMKLVQDYMWANGFKCGKVSNLTEMLDSIRDQSMTDEFGTIAAAKQKRIDAESAQELKNRQVAQRIMKKIGAK